MMTQMESFTQDTFLNEKNNIKWKSFTKSLYKIFKKKYKISDYGLLWIFFMEGLITGGFAVYIIS